MNVLIIKIYVSFYRFERKKFDELKTLKIIYFNKRGISTTGSLDQWLFRSINKGLSITMSITLLNHGTLYFLTLLIRY